MQKLLQQKLHAAVSSLFRQNNNISNFAASEITLYRLKSAIGYRCAIALQLARQKISSLSLAEQLMLSLTTICLEESDLPQLHFTVLVNRSGWLEFCPSDRTLAVWLQQIFQRISFPKQELLKEILPHLFNLQYAHARCCCLLRLGHREGLIQFNEIGQGRDFDSIPWLDKKGTLRLIHPTEIDLIGKIIEVVDAFNNEKINNWIKLATELSEAVLECDRACRILGEVRRNNAELSQARLGLYGIAQLLLQKLLEEKMKLWAPVEL